MAGESGDGLHVKSSSDEFTLRYIQYGWILTELF
jgi:hypothetical protein